MNPDPTDKSHLLFMEEALTEAKTAFAEAEVPVGSLLVVDGEIVARSHNRREAAHDPLSHAEIEVIRAAAQKLGRWRLGGTLYVTLEPCPMCVGAMIQARIEHVVFGCADPKAGALGGVVDLQNYPWNHRLQVSEGILETACRDLLQEFFRRLRVKG